jgi:DNA N-6-adenine-methyltransferase (Dam)
MTLSDAQNDQQQLFVTMAQGQDSDERYTPRWVFDALGETFDLDVAAPVVGGDCVPAGARYTRLEDGLAQQWWGFIWCNPPFSEATRWADRFRAHGSGLWLGPVANARWFIDLAADASALWLMRDFPFIHPTHAGRRSSMPLAMAALGARGAAALGRAAQCCGPTAGVLVRRAGPGDGR